MSKYAIMIGSSHAYAMGLNATLNALDYYGVKDTDVYVFSNKYLKEYFDYLKGKFDYPLFYIDTEELVAPYPTKFANDDGTAWKDTMFFWGKYPLLYQIKDKYDAIMHLDADMMVVDDVSPVLKDAAETGNLLIVNNGRSSYRLEQITEPRFNVDRNTLLDFCWGFPVINYVFCFDAKKYIDFIDWVWALRNDADRNTKNFGLETAYFVEGLYKCNLIDKVVPLSFNHWLSDDYLCKTKIPLELDKNGKYHLIAPDGENIKVVHGRFWNVYTTKQTIELTNPSKYPSNSALTFETLLHNAESHTRITDFLNYDWKSKLNEIVSLYPHYSCFIPPDRPWNAISNWVKTGEGLQ
jgi:hypothetical protein